MGNQLKKPLSKDPKPWDNYIEEPEIIEKVSQESNNQKNEKPDEREFKKDRKTENQEINIRDLPKPWDNYEEEKIIEEPEIKQKDKESQNNEMNNNIDEKSLQGEHGRKLKSNKNEKLMEENRSQNHYFKNKEV